jgi:hypothetical protein
MDKLMEKVKKELNSIAEKGLSSSNLETTYKLIDIYKDIKEAEYYESEIREEQGGDYGMPQRRDSRGRYMNDGYDRYYDPVMHGGYDNRGYDNRGYDNRSGHGGTWEAQGRYSNYPFLDERSERYIERMMEGMDAYNEGRDRYRRGEADTRMVDGIEMAMAAVCMFVESIAEFAETPKEKEIIRKHLEKMKKI